MLTAREAERELEQGVELNPGPWREHSLSVAGNARLIAGKAEGMDADTAYIQPGSQAPCQYNCLHIILQNLPGSHPTPHPG